MYVWYVIALNQGDYYQSRGGYDWGRCDRRCATRFGTREEAQRVADALKPFGAHVEEE